MSRTDSGRGSPRAVVHKRILDVAASSPDASMEAIADEVSGATTDLVERVFEEYGDPVVESTEAAGTAAASPSDRTAAESATDQTATDQTATDQTATDKSESATMQENGKHATGDATAAGLDPSSLTDRQHETLRLVHDHPGWTQADVADHLGVSRATVSRRLNDIPGFEWTDRESFTGRVFADDPGTDGDADGTSADADGERPDSEDADGGPVAGNGGEAAGGRSIRVRPELAHKVLHACMHS